MFLKNSSPGWDNFQSNVIKDTFDLLLLPLTHLLNFSITHGVFPDELKIAKVIPILNPFITEARFYVLNAIAFST